MKFIIMNLFINEICVIWLFILGNSQYLLVNWLKKDMFIVWISVYVKIVEIIRLISEVFPYMTLYFTNK
jgi:hypothetical protein